MRLVLVLAILLVLAGCGSTSEPAAVVPSTEPPTSTAMAQRGTFKLVARALLHTPGSTGELKATWLDVKQRCDVERKLRVSYRVDLVVPSGTTIRRTPPAKTGAVQNCAEGGPNFGFDVGARGLGMACPSGAWKPGRYSIGVTAVDLRSGLSVNVFLYRQVTQAC